MKKVKLIRDGMNKPFKLQPWGPEDETLAGRYRPMTPAQVEDLREAVAGGDRKNKTAIRAEHLVRHVLEWNVEGELPTAANLAALPTAHLDGLELVVTGYAGSGAEDDEKKS